MRGLNCFQTIAFNEPHRIAEYFLYSYANSNNESLVHCLMHKYVYRCFCVSRLTWNSRPTSMPPNGPSYLSLMADANVHPQREVRIQPFGIIFVPHLYNFPCRRLPHPQRGKTIIETKEARALSISNNVCFWQSKHTKNAAIQLPCQVCALPAVAVCIFPSFGIKYCARAIHRMELNLHGAFCDYLIVKNFWLIHFREVDAFNWMK